MVPETEEGNRPTRESLKTHRTDWKDKLRKNCLRRIREERAHLLWKIRSNERRQSADKKEIVESAFRDIVSDELQKIKQSPFCDCQEICVSKNDDLLWEYDGLHSDNSIEIESEDILIEMERLLYEELREEMVRRENRNKQLYPFMLSQRMISWLRCNQNGGKFFNSIGEKNVTKPNSPPIRFNYSLVSPDVYKIGPELEVHEEEDEFLARAVFEHMQLDNNQVDKNDKVWCPICNRGELREAYHLIYCTSCDLRLDLENYKVKLDFLKERLGEVHTEHLERGCKVTPKFCTVTIFDLTALYIQYAVCGTFEVVI